MNPPAPGRLGLALQQIRDNGFAWGVREVMRLAFGMLVWRVRAAMFGARRLHLGSAAQISGLKYIQFGEGVRARSNVWLEALSSYGGQVFQPEIVIGDRVAFSHAVHVAAIQSVRIGNDVLVGSHVLVTDHSHGSYSGAAQSPPQDRPVLRPLHSAGPVVIEDNVWIGDNVSILGPARIGRGAVIAANSVVRGEIPAASLAAGVPARVIKAYNAATQSWDRAGGS